MIRERRFNACDSDPRHDSRDTIPRILRSHYPDSHFAGRLPQAAESRPHCLTSCLNKSDCDEFSECNDPINSDEQSQSFVVDVGITSCSERIGDAL